MSLTRFQFQGVTLSFRESNFASRYILMPVTVSQLQDAKNIFADEPTMRYRHDGILRDSRQREYGVVEVGRMYCGDAQKMEYDRKKMIVALGDMLSSLQRFAVEKGLSTIGIKVVGIHNSGKS